MPTPPGNARKLSDMYDAFSDYGGQPRNSDIRDLIATLGLRQPVVVTAAMSPFQAVETNGVIFVDASGGPVTVNLPASAQMAKLDTVIKKIDSSGNAVTYQPNPNDSGALLDGGASLQLTAQNQAARVLTDGTNWYTW